MSSTKVREKLAGKMRSMRLLAVLLVPVAALLIGAAVPQARAQSVIRLDDALIRFEANLTDGDLGIQIFLDGEGWEEMAVYYPNGDPLVEVTASDMSNDLGVVNNDGITELFFESAEPEFDLETLDGFQEILDNFPEGTYTFEGLTVDEATLTGRSTLSHLLPAEPEIVFPEEDEVVNLNGAFTIDWEPVTESFPDGVPVRIDKYQVILENERRGIDFSAIVPAGVTEVTVPSQIMQTGQLYKVEVLAIERNGNQTISERTFRAR